MPLLIWILATSNGTVVCYSILAVTHSQRVDHYFVISFSCPRIHSNKQWTDEAMPRYSSMPTCCISCPQLHFLLISHYTPIHSCYTSPTTTLVKLHACYTPSHSRHPARYNLVLAMHPSRHWIPSQLQSRQTPSQPHLLRPISTSQCRHHWHGRRPKPLVSSLSVTFPPLTSLTPRSLS